MSKKDRKPRVTKRERKTHAQPVPTRNPYSADAVADRRHLLLANYQAVCSIARQAGPGRSIVVADANDPAGARFRGLDPERYADRIAGESQIPTIIWATTPEFDRAIQADYPTLALTPVPEGLVQVFVFAANGMMSAKVPLLPEEQAHCA